MVSQQSTYRHLSPPRYRRQTLAVFHSPPEGASADRRHVPDVTSALSRKWVHRSLGDLTSGNDSTRQNPKLLSSFYQELCHKYPHAFQHSMEEREATRGVFNPRPRVQFEDENISEGRKHLNSNIPDRQGGQHLHQTNWDREVGHYFKSRSNMRDCMTSADSSEFCGPTKGRHFNSQTLNRLLNEESPLRRKFQMESDTTRSELDIQEYFLEKSKARSKQRRKHCRILQRKIDSSETGENQTPDLHDHRQQVNERLNAYPKSFHGENSKHVADSASVGRRVDVNSIVADTDLKIDTLMEKMSLKMSSPESLPDSAIDIDTPSIGSYVSSGRGGNLEIQSTELPNLRTSAENASGASRETISSSGVCEVDTESRVPNTSAELDKLSGKDIGASGTVEHSSITDVDNLLLAYEQEHILQDSIGHVETGPGLLQIYTERIKSFNSEPKETSVGVVETVSGDNVKSEDEVNQVERDGETDIMSESSTGESFSSGVQSVLSCVERPVFHMNNPHSEEALQAGHSMQKFHHRDSDVDSGFGQSSSGTEITYRGRSRERTPNIHQMKASEGVLPLRSEVDCCILDEVDLMNSLHQLSHRRESLTEEDDTADARLEINKVTAEEIKIAEKYRRTRSPSPYILTRRLSHSRPNSAPCLVAGNDNMHIVDISISDKPEHDKTKTNTTQKAKNRNKSCQKPEVNSHTAKCSENSSERNFMKKDEHGTINEDLVDLIPGKNRPRCSVSSLSSSGTARSYPEDIDNIEADLPRDGDVEDNDEIQYAGAYGDENGEITKYVNDYARNGLTDANGEFDDSVNYYARNGTTVSNDENTGNHKTIAEAKVTGHERRYKPGVTSPRVNEKRQKMRNKMKSKSESSMHNNNDKAHTVEPISTKERPLDERDDRLSYVGGNEANNNFRTKSDSDIVNGIVKKDSKQRAVSESTLTSVLSIPPGGIDNTEVRVDAEVYPLRRGEAADNISDRLGEDIQRKGSVESAHSGNQRSQESDTQHRAPPIKPARTKRKKTLPADFNLSNYKIKHNEGQSSSSLVSTGSRQDSSEQTTAAEVHHGDNVKEKVHHGDNHGDNVKEKVHHGDNVKEKIHTVPPSDRQPMKGRQLQSEKDERVTDIHPEEKSNLENTKKLSASKASLLDKMGTLKTATKGKIKKLRKAVSLEKGIDKFHVEPNPDPYSAHDAKGGHSGGFPKMKKAPSLKSLASFFGRMKKKKKGKWHAEEVYDESEPVPSSSNPTHGRLSAAKRQQWASSPGLCDPHYSSTTTPAGKLLKVNQDGTQVVQLFKPATGPIGFFIARGTDKFQNGIFVSRLTESRTENGLAGLVGVGDEIIEVNGHFVRDLSQDAVYNLIAATPVVVLKVLPLIARKDL